MNIFIPLSTSHSISQQVRNSIDNQNVKCKIIECISPGINVSKHGVYDARKIRGIKQSRLLCVYQAGLIEDA
jgi:hypothetical protein